MYTISQKLFVRLFVWRYRNSGLMFRCPAGLSADIDEIIEPMPLQRSYRRVGNWLEFYLPHQLHAASGDVHCTPVRDWRRGRDECLELLGRCHERGLLMAAKPLRLEELRWLCQGWFHEADPVMPITRQIPVEHNDGWLE